jgi:cytochrome c biogenesis protein
VTLSDTSRAIDSPTGDHDATRLSTQPPPVAPPAPGRTSLLAPVRRTWRQLTSMRTALILLFLLALAAVPGAFLPQRGLNPVRVDEYFVAHPSLAPVLDRLSLFDVYAAPWFAAVYLLLFVSLIGCLGPRIRLHARALRTPPPVAPRTLSRLPVSERWETDAPADQVLEAARRSLRKARWRVVLRRAGGAQEQTAGALSAEKGYLRETGNLLFHVSLVALLVGIALGGLFGFQGTVLVKEGDGFASSVFNYDDIKPGRRFAAEDLVPFHFVLDDFRATYTEDGKALTFDADLRYAEGPDDDLKPYGLRVNSPLAVDGAKAYLIGHGYAPRVVVRDASGQVAFDQSVPCLPQGPTFLSTCVIKVPDATGEQLAFEGVFTPDTIQEPSTGRVTSVHPAADNPGLTVVGFRGDLGLDSGTPASVYAIEDRSRLEPIGDGTPQLLEPGDTWELPGGGSLTFVEPTEWATFQVTQDPGKLLALLAGCGMVLGLCLSLFVRRRRVWVRVSEPAGGAVEGRRTVVELGGLGRTGSEAFATEFAALTERLRASGSTTTTSTRE